MTAARSKPIAACALLTGLAASAFWANTELPAVAAPAEVVIASADSALIGHPLNAVTASAPEVTFPGFLARRNAAPSRAGERDAIVTGVENSLVATPVSAAGNIELTASAITVPGERGGARMEVRTTTDPFVRIENQDANRFSDLPPLVVQAGRDGEVTRVYRYDETTGEPVGKPLLEIVISERRDEIIAIGTRERPAASSFEGGLVTGDIPESVWVALAQCESGGRASVISAGGRFHGLYQFSVATWRSVGGEGLPSQASPEEQRYRAVRLQARSGWGQWPSCSRRIGVR